MARLQSWKGKVAVVTGASSGIGRLLSLRLAREQARLALVARREAELNALAEEIRRAGGEALVLPCDVGERAQVFAAADHVRRHFGPVEVLVNNAGYGRHRRFLEWELDDIERMMQVNFLGSVYWTKALLPHMVEQRRGWVVFIASVAGKIGVPDESVYAASKFAMVGLAEALSLEVEDSGVHVLTVCPGAINTPFFDAEALERMSPVSRRSMIEPAPLIEAIMKALARGQHDITVPRAITAGYIVRALAPGLMRRNVKRMVLDATKPAR
ncbi:MAG: SDR family oxidoreductase [Deltaproteobacteria bacterium]|nr:SDR family oxidoreductase [Deltaproteobacteria bacterium]